jgi:dTDP-4-amino-4,6-dideoxygalactose transaminase
MESRGTRSDDIRERVSYPLAVMRVPFANFRRTVDELRPELDAALARVLDSGWFLLGKEGEEFEREFAAWVGTSHAVGCASGTDAIELALRALGVGAGDEVVTQANTCVPTVAAITRAGATPVLCDVEPDAATIDPDSLAAAIGPRTKAVIPVHLYGQMGDIDAVEAIASERGVALIEDCAQAHGASASGRRAGTIGAAAAFSFYPTKNLGAFGDGGAVTTSDDGLDEQLRLIRQYGQADRYHHVAEGVNSRLDELQAALLRVRLSRLTADVARRNEIADRYTEALTDTPVEPLRRIPGHEHAYHLFVARAPDRDRFQAALADEEVATLVHYPRPVHGHEPYASLGNGPVPLTNAESLSQQVVSLPIYPELSDAEVEHVAESARNAALI